MNYSEVRSHIKKRAKSIPRSFIGYLKNSGEAVESAKNERNIILAVFYTLIFFLASLALLASHWSALDGSLHIFGVPEILAKKITLLKLKPTFFISAFFTLVPLFVYVITRLCCVKIFIRGEKFKKVLSDSVIEFGMNMIPVSLLFLLGALLCQIHALLIIPALFFAIVLFFILLLRGVFDAVPKEKRNLLFHLTLMLFAALGIAVIAATALLPALYTLLKIFKTGIRGLTELRKEAVDFVVFWTDKIWEFISSLNWLKGIGF